MLSIVLLRDAIKSVVAIGNEEMAKQIEAHWT
jgi:hypothetical protein